MDRRDQRLAFITQQRIQNFCWSDLPVKWLVDLDDKLRLVAALAWALDRSAASQGHRPANHPVALSNHRQRIRP